MDGICAAVNIGDDTDTVATMVGGILGALHGADAFPEHYFKVIEEANGFGLDALAEKMVRLSADGSEKGDRYDRVELHR